MTKSIPKKELSHLYQQMAHVRKEKLKLVRLGRNWPTDVAAVPWGQGIKAEPANGKRCSDRTLDKYSKWRARDL